MVGRSCRNPKDHQSQGDRLATTLGSVTSFTRRLMMMHYGVMRDSGLAMPDTLDQRWIGMHPRLARVYMTALAEQIAGERGLRPLTAETLEHVALSSLSIERLAQALLGDVALVDARPTTTEIESLL